MSNGNWMTGFLGKKRGSKVSQVADRPYGGTYAEHRFANGDLSAWMRDPTLLPRRPPPLPERPCTYVGLPRKNDAA